MKVKRRILSGLLAMSMVAGSFFINTGKTSAEDPAPWVPSPADEAFAAAAPADWAFDVTSVGLHNAILVNYPAIDNAPHDGYISKSEASAMTGILSVKNKGTTGTINGIENFTNIAKLQVEQNNLEGSIPFNIGNMQGLVFLSLKENNLYGELPDSIGSITGLVELYTWGNKLTGAIPSTFVNLINLTYFSNINTDPLSKNYSYQLNLRNVFGDDKLLVDTLTQERIDLAHADLDNYPPNVTALYAKSAIQLQFEHAQSLLEAKIEAETAVSDLFDGTNIATGITETEIAAAELLVEALPSPSETYTALTDQIALARQMLEARDTVDALLTITTGNTNLTAGITQTDITAAQDLVEALDDTTAGDLKAELQAKIDTAQALLDGVKLVSDLFTDNTKTALVTSVTQGVITAAKTAVEALPVGDTQDALLADIATAQGLLDAKTLADAKDVANADLDQKATDAKNAIDALPNLTDDEKTAAKDAVDNALTDAKDAVNLATTPADVVTEKDSGVTKINDEVTKAEVLDTLNAAKTVAKAELDQKATDAKNAIDALPNLTDSEKIAEKNKVETDLTDAKTAVDVAGDTIAVNNAKNSGDTNITNDLNDAIALDAANLADAKTAAKAELVAKAEAVKNAIDALTGLSTVEKNTAKDAINAELTRGSNAIDAATTIAKVIEEKTTSIANMDNILAKAQKVSDAKNTVNDLFDNTGKIKDTVNQDIINLAKEKVNGLEPGTEKDQLNALIANAEKQLAERNSEVIKPISKAGSGTQLVTNASTGDETNLFIYIVGLLLAMVSVGFILRRKHIKQ